MYISRNVAESDLSNVCSFILKTWENRISNMNSFFRVHNIKLSLKLQSPFHSYFKGVILKNNKIKQKNFGNFRTIYCKFTYVFFNTSTDILHCNVTKIRNYRQIFSSKKELKKISQNLLFYQLKLIIYVGLEKLMHIFA